jgi:hypothetical protein
MSSFAVTPAHLRTLAQHMGQFANQIGKLDLPQEDFGSWTGNANVAELIHDFNATMDRDIKNAVQTIEVLGQALLDGANAYEATDQISAVGPGQHGQS